MSSYDELAAIDRSIRDGDTNLLEVLDFMRTMRLTHFSRDQIAAATACNNVTRPPLSGLTADEFKDAYGVDPRTLDFQDPAPVPPKPAPIRNLRRA